MLRLYQGSKLNLRSKSGIFVAPNHFEYYIDHVKTAKGKVKVTASAITATLKDATEKGYCIFDRGEITVRNRIDSDDKRFHDAAKEQMDRLKKTIIDAFENADKDNITSEWLQIEVDKFHHPEKYLPQKEQTDSFFDQLTDFRNNAKKKVNGKREGDKSDVWKKNFDVLVRALHRYEYFIQLSDSKRKDFALDIDTMDKDTLEDIESYLRNEHTLLEEYPKIFAKFPANTDTKRKSPKPQPRGNNTICALFNKLKAFYNWAIEKNKTTNNPFKSYEGVTSERYGTPFYITLEERNQIADFDLSARPALAIQRDIFIFQCCIGCRVSDLMRLTESNIIDGAVEYIPTKTKRESQRVVSVPLNNRAMEILNRYKGSTKKGLILPFISAQKYNDAIKEIFTLCGVTRNVTVMDSVTGEEVQRPINEVASSHMARRCFVGNLYQKVQDPNLIASMSGHAEGSKAFARYRAINKDTKKKVVSLID